MKVSLRPVVAEDLDIPLLVTEPSISGAGVFQALRGSADRVLIAPCAAPDPA